MSSSGTGSGQGSTQIRCMNDGIFSHEMQLHRSARAILESGSMNDRERAEKASRMLKNGFTAVRLLCTLGKAVPAIGDVCGVANEVLREVARLNDKHNDVIRAGQLVLDVLALLERMEKLMTVQELKADRHVQGLRDSLKSYHKAIQTFGKESWMKRYCMLMIDQIDEKSLSSIEHDVRLQLDMLFRHYTLARDEKMRAMPRDEVQRPVVDRPTAQQEEQALLQTGHAEAGEAVASTSSAPALEVDSVILQGIPVQPAPAVVSRDASRPAGTEPLVSEQGVSTFLQKVGGDLSALQDKTSIEWNNKRINDHDCVIIAHFALPASSQSPSMGALGKLTHLRHAPPAPPSPE
eukprot:scaffold10094_cov128-Isochrysis_galbana.AAC.1